MQVEEIDAESNASLSADEAFLRVRAGVTLVLLGVPRGSSVTLDLRTYVTGSKFKGFKAIPPGRVHLLTLVAPGGSGPERASVGSTGVFFRGNGGEVLAMRYSGASETFVSFGHAEPNLVEDVKLMRLDSELGFYSKAADDMWAPLVGCINEEVLLGFGVSFGRCISGAEGELVPLRDNLGKEQDPAYQVGGLHIRPIVCDKRLKGMTPEEITKYNIDRSEMVQTLIRTRCGGDGKKLIGELQASFICFLSLFSFPGLELWKAIIDLLTACESLALKCPELFLAFVATLSAQLKVVPADVFTEDLETNNFLRTAVTRFFHILDAVSRDELNSELYRRSEELRAFIRKKYDWSLRKLSSGVEAVDYSGLDNDVEEDGPTIVPYDEVQQALNRSDATSCAGVAIMTYEDDKT